MLQAGRDAPVVGVCVRELWLSTATGAGGSPVQALRVPGVMTPSTAAKLHHGSEGYDEHAGLAIVYRFAYSPATANITTATTTLSDPAAQAEADALTDAVERLATYQPLLPAFGPISLPLAPAPPPQLLVRDFKSGKEREVVALISRRHVLGGRAALDEVRQQLEGQGSSVRPSWSGTAAIGVMQSAYCRALLNADAQGLVRWADAPRPITVTNVITCSVATCITNTGLLWCDPLCTLASATALQ
jgi:hypothetical protein